MKPDNYTKAILTAIAFLLLVIACNQYISPAATAGAQGPFAGVQYQGPGNFFDARTGEVFEYYTDPLNGAEAWGKLYGRYRLTKLGQPLVKVK